MRRDLDAFAEAPPGSSPALQGSTRLEGPPRWSSLIKCACVAGASDTDSGQIAASLTALSRTVDEYHVLARREPVPARQEKALERVKNFRAELVDYREHFERMKREREQHVRGLSLMERWECAR